MKKKHGNDIETSSAGGEQQARSARPSRMIRIINKSKAVWTYVSGGVWSDQRRDWRISVIKTLNLSVRSFMNGDLQSQACAMTYRTMLAIVPALAMFLAIGRGFGLQNTLQTQLYKLFPTQQSVIDQALGFVDKYLSTASEGVFVGVGLLVLLWTLISLLGNVEDAFNLIWGVKQGRSIWRKLTDYTAMFLILPMLMICAGGLQIMMTSTLRAILHFSFMTPVVSVIIEVVSCLFVWIFFTAVYMLIPNTRVHFKNAFIAGVLSGTAFLILQWLFVSGQMYVSRYNAIYGSFSFLPLLLIWLQLVWLVCLSGAVLCYSSQNIFQFSFTNDIENISISYRRRISLAITAIVIQDFNSGKQAPTVMHIVSKYEIPVRLVSEITDRLVRVGILARVIIDEKKEVVGYKPAINPNDITVSKVNELLDNQGSSDFIPAFGKHFPGVDRMMDSIAEAISREGMSMPVGNITIEG